MKISENGINLLIEFEGFEANAYRDIAGKVTIGYGHTGPSAVMGATITQEEGERLLRLDLYERENGLNDWCQEHQVTLNQNEFDGLVSFIFNVGLGAFKRSSVARYLREGKRYAAAAALMDWNKATIKGQLRPVAGLTRRRASERALILTPVGAAAGAHRETNVRGQCGFETPPASIEEIETALRG